MSPSYDDNRFRQLKFKLNQETNQIHQNSGERVPRSCCRRIALSQWNPSDRKEYSRLKKMRNKFQAN